MIRKAVITAAGKGTRHYPATNAVQKELFPLVDRDGMSKPTIQIIVEEAFNAGVEEICLVVQPGEEAQFIKHFKGLTSAERAFFGSKGWALKQSELLDRMKSAITYVHQTAQEGYGHAVYCARDWVKDDPFLLMLGDHLYTTRIKKSCALQLINGYEYFKKSVFAVKRTPAEMLYLFGTVAGSPVGDIPGAYNITRIQEKPDVSFARAYLQTPGLEEDVFLTFFGMHLLTPAIFDILEEHIRKDFRENGEIQLTSAQAALAQTEGAFGMEIDGIRLDMGTPLGLIETQMTLALKGPFSHDVLNIFKELTQN